jgi:hypothetical protein
MRKFLCTHTLPANAYTFEQICQLSEAAQHESDLRGYRSFFNLSEGKICCVLEAERRESIVAWFKKMGISFDGIYPLEFEGERGVVEDLRRTPVMAGVS